MPWAPDAAVHCGQNGALAASPGADTVVGMAAIRFEREAGRPPAPVELDESQRAVVALGDDASAAVLGAPGTGKTTTIVEVVADRVLTRGWSPDELLVLSSSRAGGSPCGSAGPAPVRSRAPSRRSPSRSSGRPPVPTGPNRPAS